MKEKFVELIQGPVYPIITPFNQQGHIEESALTDYIEYILDKGAKTVMCTVGSSRYDVLTADEISHMNGQVAKLVSGRATVIASTPSTGPLKQSMAIAEQAQRDGCDVILGIYPERFYGEESIFQFFNELSKAVDIGVMIHEMPIRAGRLNEMPAWSYSMKILERILKLENVVGMKEESGDAGLIERINHRFSENFAIIGGKGGMGAYLNAAQFGQKAYLVGIGNIIPHIEEKFFNYVNQVQKDRAITIIDTYETPFFDVAVSAGWHPALKQAMSCILEYPKYERLPMTHLEPGDAEKIDKAASELLSNIEKTEL